MRTRSRPDRVVKKKASSSPSAIDGGLDFRAPTRLITSQSTAHLGVLPRAAAAICVHDQRPVGRTPLGRQVKLTTFEPTDRRVRAQLHWRRTRAAVANRLRRHGEAPQVGGVLGVSGRRERGQSDARDNDRPRRTCHDDEGSVNGG
jgi:hypothetical protein